jgi:hypothetical protein
MAQGCGRRSKTVWFKTIKVGKACELFRGEVFSFQATLQGDFSFQATQHKGAFLFKQRRSGRSQGKESKAHEPGRSEVYLLYIEFLQGEVQRSYRFPGSAPCLFSMRFKWPYIFSRSISRLRWTMRMAVSVETAGAE